MARTIASPSLQRNFISKIMRLYRGSIMDDTHKLVLRDLDDRVNRIASQAVNKPHLELFGSYVSGFCKPTSDADFSLTFRGFNPWLQGVPYVDSGNVKRLTRLAKALASEGMKDARFIQAKIPVVQFVDSDSGIPCDVTLGNVGGIANSKMLHTIHKIHWDLIGAYVNVVKQWGKARELIAPEKQMFNSFTVTTMALQVLQELLVVPVFTNCSGSCGELTTENVEAALEGWKMPTPYEALPRDGSDDEKLGEGVFFLFQRFAEYYARKFSWAKFTVSLTEPRKTREAYERDVHSYLTLFREQKRAEWEKYFVENPKDLESSSFPEEEFESNICFEKSQRPSNTPFVVEDFANYINCGRRLPFSRLANVPAIFARLDSQLNGVGSESLECSFEKVFEVSNNIPTFMESGPPVTGIGKRVYNFQNKW